MFLSVPDRVENGLESVQTVKDLHKSEDPEKSQV